ncbi:MULTISPECIES: nitrilase-related carbon-nitrogen hydrolase [unclassified Corynebacterium]|uniref:nitrilase-related carbon-nitrogen hydrolase n=1 Tax=unclassified Corynebacterium TaxID=2624378 RepID=UPI0030AE7F5F
MRIALVQLLLSDDPQDNKSAVLEAIERGKNNQVDLLVFPEATMKAFGAGRLDTVAEPLDGPWATEIAEAAAAAGVTVVVGMFRPADTVVRDGKERNRIFNTLLCAGPEEDGSPFVEYYDKRHLFDAFGYNESDTVAPGEGLVVVDIPVRNEESGSVSLGLSTCFDVRFPEQFVSLAELGAQVIALPASWNDGPGKVRQWQTLVSARALDSTCFVAATGAARPGGAAKAGRPEGPTGVGHSFVASPDGDVLGSAGYDQQFVMVDIDLNEISRLRKEIPVLEIRDKERE